MLPLAPLAAGTEPSPAGRRKLYGLLGVGLLAAIATREAAWSLWLAELVPGAPAAGLWPAALLGLGWGWPGVALLFFARRTPEEGPPPRWMAVYTALACLRLVTSPDPLLASVWLAPLAALGLADFATRQFSQTRGLALTLGLLGAQVVSTAVAWNLAERNAPEAAWRQSARKHLEPGDTWVGADWRKNYLAGVRFGLPTAARDALPATGRIVVERDLELSPSERTALVARGARLLTADGLTLLQPTDSAAGANPTD